jgi:hypothetical protein
MSFIYMNLRLYIKTMKNWMDEIIYTYVYSNQCLKINYMGDYFAIWKILVEWLDNWTSITYSIVDH